MALQGPSLVTVLLLLGTALMGSRYGQRCYGAGHGALVAALLLLGLVPSNAGYLRASVLIGLGMGVNALVSTNRIAYAPVDEALVSAHLTLSARRRIAGRTD